MKQDHIEIRNLKKYFPYKKHWWSRTTTFVKAVDGIDFDIPVGKTFGLVGESGCGKSTVGKMIVRLTEPTDGSVIIDGQDILKLPKSSLKGLRRNVQIIFQDPFGALDPNMRIGDIVAEPYIAHEQRNKQEREEKVAELLELVGLDPNNTMDRFPHEFSGGQRQRINIARSIALHPQFIICDEAVSALDVSVQAQILNLLKSLQNRLGLTYLFISHNLGVIHHLSSVVGVMYLGKIVEIAPVETLFSSYRHPYTEALMTVIPVIGQRQEKKRVLLRDEIPDPMSLPSGCRFHPRCPYASPTCRELEPVLREIEPDWFIACHHPLERGNR
jgi:oligopeptide/dipeptide ABC transporter ATP-binding protein